jgi:selenium metabolism protein YedF
MKIFDCRNMACPAPVITVKKALQEFDRISVLLDDGAPRENVGRFARNRGYEVNEQPDGTGGWILVIIAAGGEVEPARQEAMDEGRILLITSNRMGEGPEELGTLLMKNFINTLLETAELPSRIFLVNTAVFLATEGSDLLETLEKLQGMGVAVFSCGLCLNYFGLKDKLRVGATTNMLTLADSLLASLKVIKL